MRSSSDSCLKPRLIKWMSTVNPACRPAGRLERWTRQPE